MTFSSKQEWSIEQRKQGNEIYVVSSQEGIFIGEGYDKEERNRRLYLASIIVNTLNENDTGLYSRADELAMEKFEKELKEQDWGHQPS